VSIEPPKLGASTTGQPVTAWVNTAQIRRDGKTEGGESKTQMVAKRLEKWPKEAFERGSMQEKQSV
jgi:hypothetical protein